ncbi:DUF2089 family protein [Alloscardovia criceti]|uniref:DUF2089 family protein n=1 Tax=Alloscardovia criceti TaxID=356828 RepID=UPI0003650D7B|nr:DUF2089 family protein [Alloscardovia criceti]
MTTAKSWMQRLTDSDAAFVKNFVLASGSLKQMSELYQVSYPTLRGRLNRLIEKIRVYDSDAEDVFILTINALTVEKKIDAETARLLVDRYYQQAGKSGKSNS